MPEYQGVIQEYVDTSHDDCRVSDAPRIGKPNVQRPEQVVETDKEDAIMPVFDELYRCVVDVR